MTEYSELMKSLAENFSNLNVVVNSRLWLLLQSFVAPLTGSMIGAGLAFGSNYFAKWYAEKKEKRHKHQLRFRLMNATFLGLNRDINLLLKFKGEILESFGSNHQTFFLIPIQIFDETPYADNLSFVGTDVPVYLDPLRRAREYLFIINDYIKTINDYLLAHQHKSSEEELKISSNVILTYAKNLGKTIDSALWFLAFSVECLKNYSTFYFPDDKFLFERNSTKYDKLLPSPDYNQEYMNNLKKVEHISYPKQEKKKKSFFRKTSSHH